jgi:polysaccharide chain length determinant protein (PEP-CTERM system associated)
MARFASCSPAAIERRDKENHMLRNGMFSVAELKRLFRRYWWLVPTSMVATALLGYIGTLVLPKKYTSTTMVLAEPQQVSRELVAPVVDEDLYREMSSMQEQILSQTTLQSMVEKFHLYANEREPQQHMEDLVDRLKKSIDVELIQPMPGSVNRQPPGFHISVKMSDPQLAQRICAEITSMFIVQKTSGVISEINHTTEFLTTELADAKTNLDQQEAKVAEFKRQRLGSLPEEQQNNLSLLTTYNSQLDAANQSLSRAQQDKTFNESLLAQQEATFKSQSSGVTNTDTLQVQLDQLQDQLTSLEAKYTPEHPDVIKTKKQIEDVKRQMASGGGDSKGSASNQAKPHEPAAMQQLRAKVKLDDLSIADATKRQAQIEDQIRALQSHVQSSPMVEQQLKELTRNYQTALDNYNDLLKRQQKSTMAGDLQNQQQSGHYRILDPPSLPSKPSFPKKSIFVGGGLGVGLVLAFGMMYLFAMNDKAMYSERDVEACLKLPVLTMVPGFDVTINDNRSHALR